MTQPSPRIDYANLPAPTEGILVTMFITVRKVARSRDFGLHGRKPLFRSVRELEIIEPRDLGLAYQKPVTASSSHAEPCLASVQLPAWRRTANHFSTMGL